METPFRASSREEVMRDDDERINALRAHVDRANFEDASDVERMAADWAGHELSKETKASKRESRIDDLTQLPNLNGLGKHYDKIMREVASNEQGRSRPSDAVVAVLFDIKRFKDVNESIGFVTGNQLLVGLAEQLEEDARHSDVVGRIGGDEFCKLIPVNQDELAAWGLTLEEFAQLMVDRIHRSFERYSNREDAKAKVEAHAKVAIATGDNPLTLDKLLDAADPKRKHRTQLE